MFATEILWMNRFPPVVLKTSALLCGFALSASGAFASTRAPVADLQNQSKPTVPRAELQASGAPDSNAEYFTVLGQLEQLDASGRRATLVSKGFFQSLSWIGRTACLNYVCGILSLDQCRRVLELGLTDDALVVRDHALRVTLSSSQFTAEEKKVAAERAVQDSRNYRKGRPFWIVDRARGYLYADSGSSMPR